VDNKKNENILDKNILDKKETISIYICTTYTHREIYNNIDIT